VLVGEREPCHLWNLRNHSGSGQFAAHRIPVIGQYAVLPTRSDKYTSVAGSNSASCGSELGSSGGYDRGSGGSEEEVAAIESFHDMGIFAD
jgi:hypothetical protein